MGDYVDGVDWGDTSPDNTSGVAVPKARKPNQLLRGLSGALQGYGNVPANQSGQGAGGEFNPVNTYTSLGSTLGKLASKLFAADGAQVDYPTDAVLGDGGETEYVVPKSKARTWAQMVMAGLPADPRTLPPDDGYTPIPPSMRGVPPPPLDTPSARLAAPLAPAPPPLSTPGQDESPEGEIGGATGAPLPVSPKSAQAAPPQKTTLRDRLLGSAPPPPPTLPPGQLPPPPQVGKPGILNRIAAGALGAATGYVNASGRAKIDPNTAAAAEQNILHPGLNRQMSNYQMQVAQAQAQAKLNTEAAQAESWRENAASNKELREATAEQRRAAPGMAADKLKADTENRRQLSNEKLEQAMLKPWGDDVQLQKEGDPVPPGMEVTQSLTQPGMVWVHPPRMVRISEALSDFAPGRQVGDLVPYSEFKRIQDRANEYTIKNIANKPTKSPDAVQLAIRAAGGNPDDPTSITPEIAKKASEILKPNQMGGIQLTPEAVQFWAQAAAAGVPLPSMGMGASGAKAREQIINAAPTAANGTPLVAARAEQRADTTSLANIQKMRDAVVSFEKTANANIDILLNTAKPLIDSGSPLVNTPLRAINRNALGGADLAAYEAARRVAVNEVAKITSNPTLVGQLSDTARKEIEDFIPSNATLGQIYKVAGILRQDMANRHKYLDQTASEIKGRMGGRGGQAGNSGPKTAEEYLKSIGSK